MQQAFVFKLSHWGGCAIPLPWDRGSPALRCTRHSGGSGGGGSCASLASIGACVTLASRSLRRPRRLPEVRETLRRLDGLLAALAPSLRLAWMLRNVEGQSLSETARACRCSLATVKRRIAAADRRLRKQLNLGDEPVWKESRRGPPAQRRARGRFASHAVGACCALSRARHVADGSRRVEPTIAALLPGHRAGHVRRGDALCGHWISRACWCAEAVMGNRRAPAASHCECTTPHHAKARRGTGRTVAHRHRAEFAARVDCSAGVPNRWA